MSGAAAAGVIPARFGSTRFPGKPLHVIAGKPLIQWVYERASAAELLDSVVVATDDERIFQAVLSFGGRAVMTRSDHPTGTDRIAEVVEGLDCHIVVNIQGDEPLIEPALIDRAVSHFTSLPGFRFGSAMTQLSSEDDINNPNIVKVVAASDGRALYFSRSPIPYRRAKTPLPVYQHIGFYVYSREFLLAFPKMQPSPLEQAECLEQLRALENGVRIDMIETDYRGAGVDTPEDAARVEKILSPGE